MHAATVGYAAGNVTLSAGVLALAFRRRDPDYHRERRAALVAYLGALPVFYLVPTAPPRTLDGFVDTIAGSGIDIEHPFLLRFYNPIAAVPSLHCAFAVVTGSYLAGRHGLRRLLWRAYAPGVALVVIATGNHYTLDVASGVVLGRVARALTAAALTRRAGHEAAAVVRARDRLLEFGGRRGSRTPEPRRVTAVASPAVGAGWRPPSSSARRAGCTRPRPACPGAPGRVAAARWSNALPAGGRPASPTTR